jgi:hypothetical protein
MLVFTLAITAQKNQEIGGISESILTLKNSKEYINSVPLNIPLNILEIPKPKYPVRENGTICVTGNVRLRVQFLASGKIGKISPVSSLPYGLTEKAIEAAEKIKFEPAIKDGEPITVFKVVVMSFTIY